MPNQTEPSLNLPINYQEVLERVGGDASFLSELLNMYIEDYDEKAQLIQDALNGQDFVSIQKLGHSLKGSSANLSLASLQKASLALELAGRDKNLDQARDAFTCLQTEFAKLKDYLQKHPPAFSEA